LEEQRILISEREEFIGIIEKGNDELKQLEAELTDFNKRHPNYSNGDSQSLVIFVN